MSDCRWPDCGCAMPCRGTNAAPQAADDARPELKTVLDREAATTKRYDEKVDDLTQKLAHHEAHEYEHRAWAAEAQVEELTREKEAWRNRADEWRTYYRRVKQLHYAATAQIAALREALKVAADIIGHPDDAMSIHIRAALAATEPAKESEPQMPKVRWARPQGDTFEAMRANVRTTGLYQMGDAILVWVNEGDFLPNAGQEFATAALVSHKGWR
jgi:hypothetical protein